MDRPLLCCLAIVGVFASCIGRAHAEVTASDPNGFAININVEIEASPQVVYRHVVENLGNWWDPSHTFSGDAKNLYLEVEPKGWMGERLPDGGFVQHMEVVFAAPGKVLRLRGALGPLQEYALIGVMTWTFAGEKDRTKLTLKYNVGGYRAGGVAAFANPVHHVLTSQLARLKRYVETGAPNE